MFPGIVVYGGQPTPYMLPGAGIRFFKADP